MTPIVYTYNLAGVLLPYLFPTTATTMAAFDTAMVALGYSNYVRQDPVNRMANVVAGVPAYFTPPFFKD